MSKAATDRELFDRALDLPANGRAAFLAEHASDAAMRERVGALLNAHDRAGDGFLARSAGELAAAAMGRAGRRLGAYQIAREIGRGGMGAVYLATRADDAFQKEVAIKIVAAPLGDDELVRRFRRERQILAELEHPHIARLLDGGTTEDGLPYLVMEYVDGVRIDDYCIARELSIADRLRLFVKVCDAVQLAHNNLVVHRDLKPGNILVTADGEPKLLDFGIASLVNADGGASHTRTALAAMTPECASPEQIRGERVTAASDVYSLGVLLYELLAGVAPYPLDGRRPDEVYRLITETEPARPSAAAERAGKPALARRLRGDLDAIVLAALRKEPLRRYASVTLLADDLRRFLDGQPVTARGEAVSYRARKFVRRHRLGVGAAAAVLLTLIGGTAATTRQARVAEEQRREAEIQRLRAERRFTDVRKLANSVLFDYHDAIEALPGATAVRERLVKDALAYLDSLAAEAGGDPALQRELAAGYDRMGNVLGRPYAANVGDIKGAMVSFQKALRIREALVTADPLNQKARRDLAQSHRRIGWQLLLTTEFGAISDHFRQAIAIYTQLVAEQPGDIESRIGLASAHNELGTILEDRGDLAAALENERRALTLLEEVPAVARGEPELRRTLSITHDYIARSLFLRGHVAAALESNGKALELRAGLASQNPTNATFRRMLAISYQNDGDFRNQAGDSVGALASFRRKLAIDEELLAADPANAQAHGDLAYSLQRLGDILAARGVHAEALPYYRRAADEYQGSMRLAADTLGNLRVALSHAGVGRAQASVGQRTAALEAVRRAETAADEASDDPSNSSQRGVRAQAYQYLAEAYAALAVRDGIAGADARADWSAACRMWQQSGDVWVDMRRRGILATSDASKPDTVARELDRCKARLEGRAAP